MRILLIGILTFIVWTAFSAWFYTCNIRSFCNDDALSMEVIRQEPVALEDSSPAHSPQPEVSLPDKMSVHFPFDSDEFTPGEEIEQFILDSKKYLEANQGATILLTGYTDAIGTEEYNQELGLNRAQSVEDYFQNQGYDEEDISLISRGENEPVADNSNPEGRALNRRVEITIKSK